LRSVACFEHLHGGLHGTLHGRLQRTLDGVAHGVLDFGRSARERLALVEADELCLHASDLAHAKVDGDAQKDA
jgi:hypothetical protein